MAQAVVDARPSVASLVVTGLLLAGIVAVGTALRLAEPLSSPALGAEDPYSHVVFTKEALDRGWFGDSVYMGTPMYPPGLHAFGGAIAPLSGITLYDFARFAPVVFGALAVLGTYVLAGRLTGSQPAGLVAALVTALMPEHVFRTDLYFPTALDLAILPAVLLMMFLAAEGALAERRRGAVLVFVVSVPLAFTHPWAVPLFLAPALGALMLRVARDKRDWRTLVEPAAAATLATAFAMASRWRESDTGFADFFGKLPALHPLATLQLPAPLLFVALVVIVGAAAALGVGVAALASRVPRGPRTMRIALAAILAAALVLVALRLGSLADLPPGVNYENQLGLVAITLALVGVAVACLAPTPAGDLGLALGGVMMPLTAINLFASPFWPQRTVAYLCIPIALLAASAVARPLALAVGSLRSVRVRRIAAPLAAVCVVLLVAGGAAARPAHPYSWYRLYSDEDFHAFERTAGVLAKDPDARVVVYGWQPALVLKTLGSPTQPWYSPKYFQSQTERDHIASDAHGKIYVVYDSFTKKQCDKGRCDASFLQGGGYRLVYRSASGTFQLYEVTGR